jgi:hypothetical protein
LDPNQRFSSTAYAFRAQVADNFPDVNQLTQDFEVASGESITTGDVVTYLDGYVHKGLVGGNKSTFGSPYEYDFGSTISISTAALSSTKFVVAYSDGSHPYMGFAVIGEVSDGQIVYGRKFVFDHWGVNEISVTALSDTKFVVVYSDLGNESYGTAVVGEVSGRTITYGSEYVFNTGVTLYNSTYNSTDALNSTRFVIAYMDEDNGEIGKSVVGDVSGSTITFGPVFTFNTGSTEGIALSALSDTSIVVAYTDKGNSNYGTVVKGEIAGTTITYTPEFVFNSDLSSYISSARLSGSTFVIAYRDTSTDDSNAVIGEVSGNSISFGTVTNFNEDAALTISAAALSEQKFVVTYVPYEDFLDKSRGKAVIGNVSGDSITFGPERNFNPRTTNKVSVAGLSPINFVVAYGEIAFSDFVSAVIGDIVDGHVIGIAKTSATAGETVSVIVSGVSDIHTGLIPGEIYYPGINGDLTTTPTHIPIGLAISDTELLLDITFNGR